jgi:hypothetical protein
MLFYTRDSGGGHEVTPSQYVEHAIKEAQKRGLKFTGTAAQLMKMIQNKLPARGDLFQDQNISGNRLNRPGLDAMFQAIALDTSISHVFIPRPDRLARPDHAVDGLNLEHKLRQELGVSIIFIDREMPAIPLGESARIDEQLVSMLGYHTAERFRHELAQKTLHTQRGLASQGFSTGGRAKYGFCRWLFATDGTPIRRLQDGENVRTKGQHVRWLPDESERWDIRCRIVAELFKKPASQIARELNKEGVPSPDRGRTRRERNGVDHEVSGTWNQSTIIKIGRDPINIGVIEYGARLMGDKLRFGPDGPRSLVADDFRVDGKPKVVMSPPADRIRTPVGIQKTLTEEDFAKLQQILDRRAGSQRGKPRSRTPEHNPLGARVFDLDCGWPMYRSPYLDSFRYTCGAYLQSCGSTCNHNHVDGPVAVKFTLACLQQRFLLKQGIRDKLAAKLRAVIARERQVESHAAVIESLQRECRAANEQRDLAARNMAFANTTAQRVAVAKVFDELERKCRDLNDRLDAQRAIAKPTGSIDEQVATLMAKVDRLSNLVADPANYAAIAAAFGELNARLFLRFKAARWGKRTVRRPAGGILTFGDAPAPINL